MATLTMSSHAHAQSDTMAIQREPRREPRKRLSAGHTPPQMPSFTFPAAPAPHEPEQPQSEMSPSDLSGLSAEPGPEEGEEPTWSASEFAPPFLLHAAGHPTSAYPPSLPPSLPATDYSNSPVSPSGGSPFLEVPSGVSGRSAADNLPSFTFGSGSGFDQATAVNDVAPRRRHKHKRSTAQSIDISAIDLKPRSSDGPKTPGEASDSSRTPLTPHKFTFGPSQRMEEAEAQSTPPSSRGSSIRFSDPADLAAFNRPAMQTKEPDESMIDLDLADVPNPPSPRSRHNRRASLHSSVTRMGINGIENHRRTESAPQLAAPIWMQDTFATRRQSAATSSFFPMEDVFEEDEGDEPASLPGMSNSALPSPQTTLATPRLDTASSSALSISTSHQSVTSTGERRPSRRKLFGRRLFFWNSSASLDTSSRAPSLGASLNDVRPTSRSRFASNARNWLDKGRGILPSRGSFSKSSQSSKSDNGRPQTSQTLPLSGRGNRFSMHSSKPSTAGA